MLPYKKGERDCMSFTKKQEFILKLIAEACTNQVIADKFSKKFHNNCGVSNVEHHIKAIYDKIQIPDTCNQRVYAANYYQDLLLEKDLLLGK